jgi:hypothetical protein
MFTARGGLRTDIGSFPDWRRGGHRNGDCKGDRISLGNVARRHTVRPYIHFPRKGDVGINGVDAESNAATSQR